MLYTDNGPANDLTGKWKSLADKYRVFMWSEQPYTVCTAAAM